MAEKLKTLQAPDGEGLLLVDKPARLTSHDVVDWARRVSGIRRIGHTGTLDPLATGLMILLIGRQYTKLQANYLKQDKTYLCSAQLGITTDTYDLEGEIIQRTAWEKVRQVTESDLRTALANFRGAINQTVPPFSAVKKDGKKLYEIARRDGIKAIELPVRPVMIHQLKLLDYQLADSRQKITFTLEISCSSGTYIRSLIHDLGQTLKTGATVKTLRRTRIGTFSLTEATICPLSQQFFHQN